MYLQTFVKRALKSEGCKEMQSENSISCHQFVVFETDSVKMD